ncbi:MAG: hypothetical protein OXH20_01960 [bacterium]|nr:hypothetical protein [bacterium]MXZ29588.1 hypothetical protein [Acidimicrobiia bacterium]MDE0667523.1 hypothetical protein [bacterium]MYB25805.1 hypothetical protein [Acidimicrobiia bacterium]MYE67374.1 hypothetical protein [Acidimicrobiia bacterium]
MSTAAALAVTLPATGLIIAVVLATGRLMWRGLSDRIEEQGRGLTARIDEHGRRLEAIENQMGQVLRALGRIEGRLGIADDSAEVA